MEAQEHSGPTASRSLFWEYCTCTSLQTLQCPKEACLSIGMLCSVMQMKADWTSYEIHQQILIMQGSVEYVHYKVLYTLVRKYGPVYKIFLGQMPYIVVSGEHFASQCWPH